MTSLQLPEFSLDVCLHTEEDSEKRQRVSGVGVRPGKKGEEKDARVGEEDRKRNRMLGTAFSSLLGMLMAALASPYRDTSAGCEGRCERGKHQSSPELPEDKVRVRLGLVPPWIRVKSGLVPPWFRVRLGSGWVRVSPPVDNSRPLNTTAGRLALV